MKKILVFGVVLVTLFIITSPVSAWHRPHYHGGFGIVIRPPVILLPPPPPVYYSPPYWYYRPSYYEYGYREWVPGHWEERWTPYGWEKVWIPGHWRYVP